MSKNIKLIGIVFAVGMITILSARVDGKEGKGQTVGGPCKYNEIPGTCLITSVKKASPDQNNCPKDPVEVLFAFAPNDKKAPAQYRFPKWQDSNQHLTIGDGKNPPRKWVVDQGLFEGAAKICKRTEITQGTCTPVIFKFVDVDYSNANNLCSGS